MNVRKVVFCFLLMEILNGQNVGSVGLNVTATLRALRPKGFRAYIYGDVDTNVLIFNGVVLYGSSEKEKRQVWGIAVKQAFGGWLFEDPNLTLKVSTLDLSGLFTLSRIEYSIFAPDRLKPLIKEGDKMSYKLNGVETDLLDFQVIKLEDPSAPEPSCIPTATKVRGRRHVCAGDVIFEDNFDTLQEDLWQIEQYIPFDHPDHPFVSYQRLTSDPNVFVENGTLHIVPKLQQNLLNGQESILSGHLNLSDGCTRSLCSKQAFGADILPPIVSGRLTSYTFSFIYGTVYVRAKVPKGDWLYPEIFLEPLLKKYGGKFGGKYNLPEILKVTLADGNRVNNDDYASVNQIYDRAQFSQVSCRYNINNSNEKFIFDHKYWGDDFHLYVLQWTPDNIKLIVDGVEYFYWQRGLLCKDIYYAFDHLHLTLGVAAGGTTMFPDYSKNKYRRPKPWRNSDPKASLRFWEESYAWIPTWIQPSLIIDYVKVVAL